MRIVYGITGSILFLVALFVCGTTLIEGVSGDASWHAFVESVMSGRWLAVSVSAALLLCMILFFVATFYQGREHYLSFESTGGDVSITLKAVHDYVTRLGDDFAAIVDLKPVIRIESDGLDITLNLKVKTGSQIPELCQVLQERVRESIQKNLGFSEIKSVRINVKEIVGALTAREPVAEKAKKKQKQGAA